MQTRRCSCETSNDCGVICGSRLWIATGSIVFWLCLAVLQPNATPGRHDEVSQQRSLPEGQSGSGSKNEFGRLPLCQIKRGFLPVYTPGNGALLSAWEPLEAIFRPITTWFPGTSDRIWHKCLSTRSTRSQCDFQGPLTRVVFSRVSGWRCLPVGGTAARQRLLSASLQGLPCRLKASSRRSNVK